MSDENENSSNEQQTSNGPEAELAMLKQRATTLGLNFHPNIGLETLRERVNAKINGETEVSEFEQVRPTATTQTPRVLSKFEQEQQIRHQQQRDHMKLVRIRIACLNPDKKDLPGEVFTVANRYLGTVRKYVPYGEQTENGYHVPHVLYEDLKQRRFQQVHVRKNHLQQEVITKKLVLEYSIEVLEPLTEHELARLANTQAASHAID